MNEVTMIISIDFIRPDAARESLTINVVTTGVMPTDEMLAEIIADEVSQHLETHAWESAK